MYKKEKWRSWREETAGEKNWFESLHQFHDWFQVNRNQKDIQVRLTSTEVIGRLRAFTEDDINKNLLQTILHCQKSQNSYLITTKTISLQQLIDTLNNGVNSHVKVSDDTAVSLEPQAEGWCISSTDGVSESDNSVYPYCCVVVIFIT